MEISVIVTSHWVTIENPLSTMRNDLKIAKEIGDRGGEGRAKGNLGNCYQSLGDYRKSIEYLEKTFENCNRNW